MSLKDWLKSGWIEPHTTSLQELTDLFLVVDRDLKACQTRGLVPDWQLNIAYNAALQLAKAALAVAGYEAPRIAHHYRVIQSLAYTIRAKADLIDELDKFRKKRNISDYEQAGLVSETEAREIFELAMQLRKDVRRFVLKKYPKLKV